jgi:hypothetical protein
LLCRELADYVRCGSHTTVFPKSKKANLNKAEKNEVKKMIALLEEQVRELHGGDEDE